MKGGNEAIKEVVALFYQFSQQKREKKQFMFGFEKWAEWYGGEAE